MRSEHHLLTVHTRRLVVVVVEPTEISVSNAVNDNDITVSMKNASQHSTKRKIVFAYRVFVLTIKLLIETVNNHV